MIKIAHEAPVSFMNSMKQVTDYDYALACLFGKIPGYYEYFEEALKEGRHVLLDNGLFEDGVPMESGQYAKWIEKLRPTEYIVPDEFDKMAATIDHMYLWNQNFRGLPGNKIGVCQGTTFCQLNQCYDYHRFNADKIAINFASVAYQNYAKELYPALGWADWAVSGRVAYLHALFNSYAFCSTARHHLLGCVLPVEFTLLKMNSFNGKKYLDYFETMDTSAPVVWGILEGQYPAHLDSITKKNKTKLKDLIEETLTPEQSSNILLNVAKFRNHLAPLPS